VKRTLFPGEVRTHFPRKNDKNSQKCHITDKKYSQLQPMMGEIRQFSPKIAVALYMGAWIEIKRIIKRSGLCKNVALYMGAWIEIRHFGAQRDC